MGSGQIWSLVATESRGPQTKDRPVPDVRRRARWQSRSSNQILLPPLSEFTHREDRPLRRRRATGGRNTQARQVLASRTAVHGNGWRQGAPLYVHTGDFAPRELRDPKGN